MVIKRELLRVAAVLALAVGLLLTSCNKKTVSPQTQPQQPGHEAAGPFGRTHVAPCQMPDDEEYFYAAGLSNGSIHRMDVLQGAALTNAQDMIRQKMAHAYRGMISSYANYVGANRGSDAATNVERAGDQIMNVIINNTSAWCPFQCTDADDGGRVQCFIGIKISKGELATKLADAVEDAVSDDEELRIRFKEHNYRERMEQGFRTYREENQPR